MMQRTLADIGSWRGRPSPQQASSLADLERWAVERLVDQGRPGQEPVAPDPSPDIDDFGEVSPAYAPYRYGDDWLFRRNPIDFAFGSLPGHSWPPVQLVGDPTPKVPRPWESGGGGAGPGWTIAPPGGSLFRSGGKNPGNLTPRPGEEGLSFRDSLSNPYPKGDRPVFRPGDKYIEVDPLRLPPGSVMRDNIPPGHVTVSPSPVEVLIDAIIKQGRFPK
jgi:hypothetical protein